jgi:hypothetical protein
MALDQACWIATAAYGAHILEEYMLDWRAWARSMSGIAVGWGIFYVANALVIVLGIVCAEVAETMPMVALAFPALMLINATLFHVAGFVAGRGRYSPGLITAVFLFYPIGIWCYKSASDAGVLTHSNLIGSLLLGALIMATPILLMKARTLRYFKQSE